MLRLPASPRPPCSQSAALVNPSNPEIKIGSLLRMFRSVATGERSGAMTIAWSAWARAVWDGRTIKTIRIAVQSVATGKCIVTMEEVITINLGRGLA